MEDNVIKEAPRTDFLKSEKVVVQFIKKPSKDIKDPKHVAYGGKLDGTFDFISPPRLRKDKMKNILTKEEMAGLEYLMGRSLSIYGDFWKSHKAGGIFPIMLGKQDKTLHLDVPEDYIFWKVLLNCALVANSTEILEREQKETYKYVLTKVNEGAKLAVNDVNNKAKAYSFFSRISDNDSALRFVLGKLGKHTHMNQDNSFLVKAFGEELDDHNSIKTILELEADDLLEIKIMVEEAFKLGVIDRVSGMYYNTDGEPLCGEGDEPTLENAAKFLSLPVGQEERLVLETRIENAKK